MNQSSVTDSEQMLALLKWYRSAGVDMVVQDNPVDQFSLREKPILNTPLPDKGQETSKVGPGKLTSAQIPIEARQGDPEQATKIAQNANTLEDLRLALNQLEGCTLRIRATQTVFGDGTADAQIMFVGKAPSRDDDLQGHTFAGPAGQLLDNMLKSIGLSRTKVYLSNIVPWRPPGNRGPAPHEVAMCLPFLKRQIQLVAPKILVTFGELATKALLGEEARLSSLRGQWVPIQINDHKTQVLTSLHPEFLLRQPKQKQKTWQDLKLIQRTMADLCQTS